MARDHIVLRYLQHIVFLYITAIERTIVWTDQATSQLMRLPWEVRDQIEEKVAELAVNPGTWATR
jgi:hypothetical protein